MSRRSPALRELSQAPPISWRQWMSACFSYNTPPNELDEAAIAQCAERIFAEVRDLLVASTPEPIGGLRVGKVNDWNVKQTHLRVGSVFAQATSVEPKLYRGETLLASQTPASALIGLRDAELRLGECDDDGRFGRHIGQRYEPVVTLVADLTNGVVSAKPYDAQYSFPGHAVATNITPEELLAVMEGLGHTPPSPGPNLHLV